MCNNKSTKTLNLLRNNDIEKAGYIHTIFFIPLLAEAEAIGGAQEINSMHLLRQYLLSNLYLSMLIISNPHKIEPALSPY
jgi:hypothetical protein